MIRLPALAGEQARAIVPVPPPAGIADPKVSLRIVRAGWDGMWLWPLDKVHSTFVILRWLVTRRVDVLVVEGAPELYRASPRRRILLRRRTTTDRAPEVANAVHLKLVTDATALGLAWDI